MKVKLEDAVAEATKNGRVCLQPPKWNELWTMLQKRTSGASGGPAAPMTAAAWSETTDREKTARQRAHLAWAKRNGGLQEVLDFMRSLPESAWYHAGDKAPAN